MNIPRFNIHFVPLQECGTAGAIVVKLFKYSYLRECGTAGAQVLQPFKILFFFLLQECGTAGAQVLQPFKIHFFPLRDCGTVGLREQ